MCNDELLAEIDERTSYLGNTDGIYTALRAVVELIQEKQKFLENTKGDIPMTNQQLGAREERTKLLAEIIQAIEKELGCSEPLMTDCCPKYPSCNHPFPILTYEQFAKQMKGSDWAGVPKISYLRYGLKSPEFYTITNGQMSVLNGRIYP